MTIEQSSSPPVSGFPKVSDRARQGTAQNVDHVFCQRGVPSLHLYTCNTVSNEEAVRPMRSI